MKLTQKERELLKIIGRKKNFWKVVKESDMLIKDFIKTMNSLYEKGLITVKNNIVFAKRPTIKKKINYKNLLKKFRRAVENRPVAIIKFYQGWVTAESVVNRIEFMHRIDDLEDKSVLLIGDDDMLSVALALSGLPKRIVVLDIDSRLGDFINHVNRKYKTNIEFIEYDVADPLPKELLRKFEIFSTEPLESYTGFLAFIARGAASLKRNGSGYIGLTRVEVGLEKWRIFEKLLLDMNFVITDVLRNFSEYEEKGEPKEYDWWIEKLKFKVRPTYRINWYTSWLIRVEALGLAKPLVSPEKRIRIDFISQEEYAHPLSRKAKSKI